MTSMTIEQYLIEKLESVAPAYAEKPEDATGQYLVVDVISAGESNCIKRSTVAVRCYADSLAEASELNHQVRDYMSTLWQQPEIARCKINTEYALNSITMMQYRYQSIYDIIHYL